MRGRSRRLNASQRTGSHADLRRIRSRLQRRMLSMHPIRKPHPPEEERAMRAANQTDAAMPVVEFTFEQGIAPKPDQEAVAGFDALLASLDPDTARHVLR